MTDSNIVPIKAPTENVLEELLKRGARDLLATAIETEVSALIEVYGYLSIAGKQAVVRNGYLPTRTIQTGLGDIPVKVPKVRDRSGSGIKFNSQLVPRPNLLHGKGQTAPTVRPLPRFTGVT